MDDTFENDLNIKEFINGKIKTGKIAIRLCQLLINMKKINEHLRFPKRFLNVLHVSFESVKSLLESVSP